MTRGAGTAGLSVLSVPNIGCTAVDANGFCTGGIYPSLHGARWIWKAHETVEEQNTSDYGPVIFVRRIDVPKKADTVDTQIKITPDNAYDLFVNAAPVGRGNDWHIITTFPLTGAVALHPGANWLVMKVTNFAGPAPPFQNPAALIYKLRVTYTT